MYNRIRGGFEESACCLQETVLIMAVWKEGDGPSRTINREEFKLKGSERRGVHVKNNKRHSGQGDIYTHKVHINCVIYKYSSPSSFQLSENKKSKCKEQLKDPITPPFWRADTVEHIHMVAVSHCPLYLQDCTYIQVQFAR